VKKALSGWARRNQKKAKARESEAGTGGIQQPGNAGRPKQGETSNEILTRSRSEGSTPTETARAPKRPRDSSGPGTYKEALTNIKIAIFRETYPENKLNAEDQNYIVEELGRVLCEQPHLQVRGRHTYLHTSYTTAKYEMKILALCDAIFFKVIWNHIKVNKERGCT
jgi:hypothetical protein